MGRLVRLACLRHAASVHPEPGSNSPKKFIFCSFELFTFFSTSQLSQTFLTFCSVFRDHFRYLFLFASCFINIPDLAMFCQHFFALFFSFLIYLFFLRTRSFSSAHLIYHSSILIVNSFFAFFRYFFSCLLFKRDNVYFFLFIRDIFPHFISHSLCYFAIIFFIVSRQFCYFFFNICSFLVKGSTL